MTKTNNGHSHPLTHSPTHSPTHSVTQSRLCSFILRKAFVHTLMTNECRLFLHHSLLTTTTYLLHHCHSLAVTTMRFARRCDTIRDAMRCDTIRHVIRDAIRDAMRCHAIRCDAMRYAMRCDTPYAIRDAQLDPRCTVVALHVCFELYAGMLLSTLREIYSGVCDIIRAT